MLGGAVVQHSQTLRPVVLLAAVAIGLGAALAAQDGPPPAADALIRLERNEPGESRPLTISADNAVTWIDGGRRAVLLQGQVFVQQGLVQARFRQGVAWADLERYRKTNVWHIDLYAEGDVRVENGAEVRDGGRALLSLTTRGEPTFNVARGKLQKQAQADDPLYRRGLAELTALSSPIPAELPQLLPTPPPPFPGTAPPAPAAPGGGLTPVSAVEVHSSPVVPAASTPGGGGARPTQGPAPVPPVPETPPLTAPSPGPGPGDNAEPAPRPRRQPGPPGPGAPPPPHQGPRSFSIAPRTLQPIQQTAIPLPNGEQAWVITGGVILQVRGDERAGLLDIEADRLVLWTKGKIQDLIE